MDKKKTKAARAATAAAAKAAQAKIDAEKAQKVLENKEMPLADTGIVGQEPALVGQEPSHEKPTVTVFNDISSPGASSGKVAEIVPTPDLARQLDELYNKAKNTLCNLKILNKWPWKLLFRN